MAHLTIALLGDFKVALDGQALTRFDTDKMRALLAYLAVEVERDHRRAMLAGLLWPEIPETAAHHNLSQTLLRLRTLLGDKSTATPQLAAPFLLATWQTLRFNPDSDHTVDVAEFQRAATLGLRGAPEQLSPERAQLLTQALSWYQGPFLSDLWLINSPAFEEWQLLKQTQLHILALEALEALGRYHIRHGELAIAVDCARRQIALEPLRESAHRQLMQALALEGRRAEALAQYGACQALLARELGIEPAAETQALSAQIRAGREGSPQRDVVREPPPRREKPVPAALPAPPAFVGRARELARLDESLEQMLAGQGQILFVTGEAGSGKTALLTAFAQRALAAHADVLVVNGTGNAYTGLGDPYWPFIEMLQQLRGADVYSISRSRGQAQRLLAVHSSIMEILADCSPDLARFVASGVGASTIDLAQTRLFEQLTRALHAIAARYPVVLLLDDLQWADRDSLNLLFHLGRNLSQHALFLVGAFRPDVLNQGYSPQVYLHEQDAGQRHPLATLIHELQHRLGDIRLDLAQSEGREFVDALIDSEPNHIDEAFRETLFLHTGGHALFTTELLREMQARGDLLRDANGYWVAGEKIAWGALPARVEGIIAERIAQLHPEWQTMLRLASIEGAEFTVQVLARVLELSEDEIGRRLGGALSRYHHLITPVGIQYAGAQRLTRYRFRHLLFQRYLYNRLDSVEQAQLHLSVGRALEALYAEHALEISLPLARHFELGGEASQASVYLLRAGERATRWGATEEALRLFARGLALVQRLPPSLARAKQETELQLALGEALLAKGWNAPERAQAFERAYVLCQQAGGSGQLARSLLNLADVKLARGQLDLARATGEQLLELARSAQDPLIAVFGHSVLGAAFFFNGSMLLAREHLEQVVRAPALPASALLARTEVGLDVRSWVWLMATLWGLGYADQAAVCSQKAVALARAEDHAFSLGFALSFSELHLGWLRHDLPGMRAALQHLGALDHGAVLSVFQLWEAIFQGWLDAVGEHSSEGYHKMQQAIDLWAMGEQTARAYQYLLLAEATMALDQVAAAHEMLVQGLAHSTQTDAAFLKAEMLRLQGEALQRLGQPEKAAAAFNDAIALAQKQAAKMWELRAALNLCRLREAFGTVHEFAAARQQLAEVYAWFTEGFDIPDLQAAAALLAKTDLPDHMDVCAR